MGEQFMILEELLEDKRIEGQITATQRYLLQLLHKLGNVSDELLKEIESERNADILEGWFQTALDSGSVEEFVQKIH